MRRHILTLAMVALLLPCAAVAAGLPDHAALSRQSASTDVVRMADRVVATADNAGLGFVIVDKRTARVFAFAADGQLRGTAPALLGLARGDINPPGIGDKPLAAIGPADRITPAGRFVAMLGHDLGKANILWVDYASGLSMHRVIRGKAADNRFGRLVSPTPDDNRISYGCINVPAAFFDSIIQPLFTGLTGIVYVLPETGTPDGMFAMLHGSPGAHQPTALEETAIPREPNRGRAPKSGS